MKRKDLFSLVIAILMTSLIFSPMNMNAQEEKSSPFDVGGDLVSSYLWRGTNMEPVLPSSLTFLLRSGRF